MMVVVVFMLMIVSFNACCTDKTVTTVEECTVHLPEETIEETIESNEIDESDIFKRDDFVLTMFARTYEYRDYVDWKLIGSKSDRNIYGGFGFIGTQTVNNVTSFEIVEFDEQWIRFVSWFEIDHGDRITLSSQDTVTIEMTKELYECLYNGEVTIWSLKMAIK
jgi:hypothetical protein